MRRTTLLVVFLALAAMAGTGCTNEAHSKTADTPTTGKALEEPAARVRVQTVGLGRLTESIILRGTVQPVTDVTVSAEAAGRIESLSIEEGEPIKRGQVIARVDYDLQKAQRDQARAGYDLAVKTVERLKALRADDMASQQQLDQAETQVLTSRAALAIATAQLRKSVVTSPTSGLALRRFMDLGEFAAPGAPLVRIVDYDTVRVSAQVAETDAARIRAGMPVTIRIDALGREITGQVQQLMPVADPKAKTFEVRIELPNPDHSILLGMAATVRIDAQRHDDVVIVQQDVVVESGEDRAVYVTTDGLARRRPVVLGAIEGDRVVIREGLAPGESLVVEGQRALHDGQKVRIITGQALAPTGRRAPNEEGS